MNRRRPVHARTVAQWIAVVVALVATVAIVVAVRNAAPERVLEPILPAAPDPDDPASEIVECERTLPAAPETQEEIQEVDPLGRVYSTEVVECPDAFDGHVVVYIGEVVGDVLRRDGGAWALVNDDDYALEVGPLSGHLEFAGGNTGLSVWFPDPLHEVIEHAGDSRRRGDVVRVRGFIQRADPRDGGGLTLTALDVEVLVPSEPVDVPVNWWQALAAAGFVLVAITLTLVERAAARRR